MRQRFFIIICISTVVLGGCWDQRLLKEHSLILAVGYDVAGKNKISKTVSFPKEEGGEDKNRQQISKSNLITTTGVTIQDADKELDRFLPQRFDRSKARIIFLGEDLAREGIFSKLNSIYRDPKGPLGASVAVVAGTAKDALNIKENYAVLVSEFYVELLESAEDSGLIKNENVQSICPVILLEGKDPVMPYISLTQNKKKAKVEGIALFSKDKMTGTLNTEEATMYLLLSDQMPKMTKFTFEVKEAAEQMDKFVDFEVRKVKRNLNVDNDNDQIKANIELFLRLEVLEYEIGHLAKETEADRLAYAIEKKLQPLAQKTITKMQEANNDSLGIGQHVSAYNHKTWERLNWNEMYPTIPIETEIHVEIVRHGIIN